MCCYIYYVHIKYKLNTHDSYLEYYPPLLVPDRCILLDLLLTKFLWQLVNNHCINPQEKKLLLERNGARVARISVFEVCSMTLYQEEYYIKNLTP